MLGVWLARSDNNILTQIGFIVLVGLACKNAILIVEFARERVEDGMAVIDAAIEACRLRLRPILMTSFAFIMGVMPLVIASGAGSEMRQAMGIAVFAGMLGVTLFGLFLTPVFFVTIELFTKATSAPPAREPTAAGSRRSMRSSSFMADRSRASEAALSDPTTSSRKALSRRSSPTPLPRDSTESDVQAQFWTLFNEPVLDELVEAALARTRIWNSARANLLRVARRAQDRRVRFVSDGHRRRVRRFDVLQSEHQLPRLHRAEREVDDGDAGFDAVMGTRLLRPRAPRQRSGARRGAGGRSGSCATLRSRSPAEVARNYFVLRGLQDQLDVAMRNAENQRQTLELTQARLDAGRGTELDTSRAEAQLQTTLASIPPLRASICRRRSIGCRC